MRAQDRKSANADLPVARKSLKASASRPRSSRLLIACLVAAFAALVALSIPGAARADSYSLLQADVAVDVQTDGSLGVSERLEVAFSGDFTFGYRDIPLREGESLVNPIVVERGVAFIRGNQTSLEPGRPGTFGVERRGDTVRIVWYFDARNQTRAFTVSYVLRKVAVAYDDVVDVNLKVWGDQWEQSLARLVGVETAPGKILRAWGKPVWVRGDVEIVGTRATLRAVDVPAEQFVELRTLIPRTAFTSTAGMRVARGNGFDRIVAEELADAEAYETDRERIDALKSHPLRTGLVALALATLPALLVIWAVFWFMGRERRTGYDREYEQEPPTDTEPALVPTLLRQGGEAGSYEFTATLFDLVRRGVYKAAPTTTERPIWAGLRSETISDLEISAGENRELRAWERDVADVVDDVLDGGSERLSRFRDEIEDERASMHGRFTAFKNAVAAEADRLSWFRSTGAVPLVLAILLFAIGGGIIVYLGVRDWRPVYPRYSDVLLVGTRRVSLRERGAVSRHPCLQPPRVATPNARRSAGSGALGGVPPLPLGLPATAGGAARDARALGALPRLRNRLRNRRARAAGRAAAHAGGARRVERDLLDLAARRPGLRRVEPLDRRPRVGLRRRACATKLGRQRRWRRLLRRGRRGRRWRGWRFWLSACPAKPCPEEPSGATPSDVAR